ncbi:GFA family protein [Sulfitobacter sp.]|uniref:GFA family protein n=1 Tax=Sulfitobacter sp. TaxID=1903071 RepID=UPI0030038D0E
MLSGSCLCGAINFAAERPARDPAACHCTQCRKQSGYHWASVKVMDDELRITGKPKWFAASLTAKRGFCPTCGSFLFWRGVNDPDISIALGALGALDGATGLRLERHIFTEDKGDYYEILGAVPQEEQET